MNIRNSLIKIICIVIVVFITGCSVSAEEYNDMITKLHKNYPFKPPASGEISEDQLMRFFAVVKVMHGLLENQADFAPVRLAGVKELDAQKMSKEEFMFISDAVYNACMAFNKQQMELSLDIDDEGFEQTMVIMNVPEEDKVAMRNARAEKRKWYKGTDRAPTQNIDLVSRHEKEINDLTEMHVGGLGGIGIQDYAEMF